MLGHDIHRTLRGVRVISLDTLTSRSLARPIVSASTTSSFVEPACFPRIEEVDPSLIDQFGRRHRYLRVSLTDKCNMRCKYCMPEDNEEPLDSTSDPSLLTATELHRLVSLFVDLGVRKVRLTGGEPTIRKDFPEILENLGQLNARVPLSLGITTNGVRLLRLLPKLHSAGVTNLNLSLDTLVGVKFPLLTRRPEKWHTRVMEAMQAAGQDPRFRLKVNCVLMRGVNEDEIGDFVNLTEHLDIEVRFLEFMPFDGNSWSAGRLVPGDEIIGTMQKHLQNRDLFATRLPPDSLNDVARLWKVPNWKGRIGLITSMTDAFCGGCNRIRLTAEGEVRNCLFGEEGWNLRDQLRAGADDAALVKTIATGVGKKFSKLGGKRDMHELQERGSKALTMMTLGG